MRAWSQSSANKLDTCHPDLQKLANAVLVFHDCTVITGHRDQQTQERMVTEGKSKVHWPNGKHNSHPSHAIDLAPAVAGLSPWDFEYSLYFAGLVLGTAEILLSTGRMSYAVRWGGNWSATRDQRSFKDVSFYDGLHFELVI
jgi:peptidoglycan L-alanyl-D-glutamate endopeptidase CwlK